MKPVLPAADFAAAGRTDRALSPDSIVFRNFNKLSQFSPDDSR